MKVQALATGCPAIRAKHNTFQTSATGSRSTGLKPKARLRGLGPVRAGGHQGASAS